MDTIHIYIIIYGLQSTFIYVLLHNAAKVSKFAQNGLRILSNAGYRPVSSISCSSLPRSFSRCEMSFKAAVTSPVN